MAATDSICIIPARGGSKRIPRKNIVDFNGKPMIAWSIETALKSELFTQVVVSTDDAEIAEIARDHGAKTPFMRDNKLSDDFATTAQVLVDALEKLPEHKLACCFYPTAPLTEANHLTQAENLLHNPALDCVISTCEYDFHPLRAFSVDGDQHITFANPQYELARSQDLPEQVHDAGAFYFFRTASFLQHKTLLLPATAELRLPRKNALDIDTLEDLELAQIYHREFVLNQR